MTSLKPNSKSNSGSMTEKN